MKYADIHEFSSQSESITLPTDKAQAALSALKSTLVSLFQPRIDPTRMTRTERREAGVRDCDIDWHNALYGPLVK